MGRSSTSWSPTRGSVPGDTVRGTWGSYTWLRRLGRLRRLRTSVRVSRVQHRYVILHQVSPCVSSVNSHPNITFNKSCTMSHVSENKSMFSFLKSFSNYVIKMCFFFILVFRIPPLHLVSASRPPVVMTTLKQTTTTTPRPPLRCRLPFPPLPSRSHSRRAPVKLLTPCYTARLTREKVMSHKKYPQKVCTPVRI